MQSYGCNIGLLYGISEKIDIYLVGLPKVQKETVTMYFWGANIEVKLPQTSLSECKLMIFNYGMEECIIHDIEVKGNTLILEPLLQKYNIVDFIQDDVQVLHQIETEVVTIGKKGFYSVSVKDRRKECQKIHLRSSCFNILEKIIEGVEYNAIVTPKEKKSTYLTVLKKIVNGSKLEVKDMVKLLTNDEEIVVPFHIDFLKDFVIYTPEFSFAYNPIDALLEVLIQTEKYLIKEEMFTTLPDMVLSKICFSIRDNTLEDDIKEYFV